MLVRLTVEYRQDDHEDGPAGYPGELWDVPKDEALLLIAAGAAIPVVLEDLEAAAERR